MLWFNLSILKILLETLYPSWSDFLEGSGFVTIILKVSETTSPVAPITLGSSLETRCTHLSIIR